MITRRERWSYAAGDLGFNFVWQSTEFYLLFFLMRDLGLSPATASAIFLAGGVVDLLADPPIGAAADRFGARIPLRYWVIVGGPLSALSLAALFAVRPGFGSPALIVLILYLASRAAYSAGNIPYAALTARISSVPADQSALSSSRMQGAAAGGLIATSVFALLPASGTHKLAFAHGALLLAILALPAFAIVGLGVCERVRPSAGRLARGGARSAVAGFARLLRGSPDLRRLLAVVLAAGAAVTVLNKALLFVFEELGAASVGIYLAILPSITLLVTAPVWTALGNRFGRPLVLAAAILVLTSAVLLALVSHNVVAVMAAMVVAIIAGEGASVSFWGLVPDAVTRCEAAAPESGGCAGQVYALVNLARKLAQALAPQTLAIVFLVPGLGVLWAAAACAVIAAIVVLGYGPRRRPLP